MEFVAFCRTSGAKPPQLPDEDPFDPDVLNCSSEFLAAEIGKTVLKVGRYKDQSYEEVVMNHRSYAVWARGLLNPSINGLKHFVQYCAVAGVERPSEPSNYTRKNPSFWRDGGWNGHGVPYANTRNGKRKRPDEDDEADVQARRQVVMSRG